MLVDCYENNLLEKPNYWYKVVVSYVNNGLINNLNHLFIKPVLNMMVADLNMMPLAVIQCLVNGICYNGILS